MTFIGSGLAYADPSGDSGQAGITTAPETGESGGQAGITSSPQSATPAPPTVVREPDPAPQLITPPPQYSDYAPSPYSYEEPSYGGETIAVNWGATDSTGWNAGDSGDWNAPSQPVDFSTLHLPTPVTEPTKPTTRPRNGVQIGRLGFKQPYGMTDHDADAISNTSAWVTAAVADFWKSVGIETSEAEKLAASQVAAGVVGFVGGALVVSLPTATVAALIGGTIGGLAGMTAGNALVPGVGWVPVGVLATLGGGAAAAGLVGIPLAVLGGVAGAAGGVALASLFATDAAPFEVTIRDIDQPAITEMTENTLAAWRNDPALNPVVTFVEDLSRQAPVQNEQIRAAIAAVPGGEGFLEHVDSQLVDFFDNASLGFSARAVSDAVAQAIGVNPPPAERLGGRDELDPNTELPAPDPSTLLTVDEQAPAPQETPTAERPETVTAAAPVTDPVATFVSDVGAAANDIVESAAPAPAPAATPAAAPVDEPAPAPADPVAGVIAGAQQVAADLTAAAQNVLTPAA